MDIEEIRMQAQDENTAPEILAELANSEDRQFSTSKTIRKQIKIYSKNLILF